MKKIIIVAAVTALCCFSCDQRDTKGSTGVERAPVVETENTFLVSELLDDPDKLVGQSIRVQGTVTHVCRHSGKRLHLAALDHGGRIRVEAGDQIVRFERELEGSDIVATGILRKGQVQTESSGREDDEHEYPDELKGPGHAQGRGAGQQTRRSGQGRRAQDNQSKTVYWLDGLAFDEIEP